MRYWWVNHKQTFKSEFNGGYIWSPKKNANGRSNPTYDNLTKTRQGDLIFSFADALIKAVGVIEDGVRDAPKPPEFGKAGDVWSSDGYLVKVRWTPLEKPFRPKAQINFIKHLLPDKYSPIQPDTGNGNQSFYLTEVSQELAECILTLITDKNASIVDQIDTQSAIVADEEEVKQLERSSIPETERNQLVKARIGQGAFRQNVIAVEKSCRITGVSDPRFLIASHIKPWKVSTNDERLDGNNGLLLSPHVDNLFDGGWISFANDGEILIGEPVKDVTKRWNISIHTVGRFNSKQGKYLEFHRDFVFGQKRITTVAAGVVEHNGKILIARRRPGLNFAGYWEFPGGKLEDGESPQDCLMREFTEELSIKIEVGDYVGQSWLKKSGKNIHLVAFRCKFVRGDVALTVHDEFVWVIKSQLKNYKMAPADIPIVELLSSTSTA
jgi:putative restriction endonuclease